MIYEYFLTATCHTHPGTQLVSQTIKKDNGDYYINDYCPKCCYEGRAVDSSKEAIITTIIKIQKGGIITIPKAMREALNIKPGDKVTFKAGGYGSIYMEFGGDKMGKPRQIKKKKKERVSENSNNE